MTQAETIIKYLMDALNFTATLGELYENLRIPHSSVRRVLSELTKRGITSRPSRGTYRFLKVYQKILHTKRVIDTYTKKPQHRYDVDIETTSIGYVPAWISLKEVEQVLNPKLISATIEQLGYEGIFLPDDDRLIEFKIMGTETRPGMQSYYTNTHH